MQPKTSFARSGDASIAYQVIGDGPRDVVFIPGFCSHLDLMWGEPAYARFMTRLASFCRLVRYDRRGTGLSDRFDRTTTLEEGLGDLRAVIEATGARTPAIIGFSEGGALAATYAATHPDEVSALVLCETFVRGRPGPGYLEEQTDELEALTERIFELADRWGEGRLVEFLGPSMVGGSVHRRFVGIFERAAASPVTVRRVFEHALDLDATGVLDSVSAPTLVLHRRHDVIPIEAGRYVADHIPGARFVELGGGDHMPWAGDFNEVASHIEAFLGGAQQERDVDRSLATIVFVSMVDATARAAELGDIGFERLGSEAVAAFREYLARFGGSEVRATGDAFVASFGGPVAAVRFGLAATRTAEGLGAPARVGIHAGEVRRISGELGGLTFHVAARVMGLAPPGVVLVTSTAHDLSIGSTLRFDSHGHHELRGLPGSWELFAAVSDVDEPASRVDPLAGFGRGERAVVRMGGNSNPASRAISRLVRALP